MIWDCSTSLARGQHGVFKPILQCVPRHTATHLVPFSCTTTLPIAPFQATGTCYVLPFLYHLPGYSKKNFFLILNCSDHLQFLSIYFPLQTIVFFAHCLLSLYFSHESSDLSFSQFLYNALLTFTASASFHHRVPLCQLLSSCKSLLLWTPEMSSGMCQWRTDGSGRGWSGRSRHTLRCQPARSRCWVVEVYTCTCVHDNIHVYRSRPIGAFLCTHHKPAAGMPGPEWPAQRGRLGVVTGIRLIQISTGGFLVFLTPKPQKKHSMLNFSRSTNTRQEWCNKWSK